VSDQIVVMDAGLIVEAGTPQELYEQPACEFVAGFMGEAMLFPGQVHADGRVTLGPLAVHARRPVAPGPVKVALRPEAWQVVTPGSGAFEGTVLKVAYLGSFQEITVATALGEIFVVSPDASHPWRAGAAIGLGLQERSVSVVAA
jgi:iron(III) transport system ATP-binding protein